MNVPLIWMELGVVSLLCLTSAVVWQHFWLTRKLKELTDDQVVVNTLHTSTIVSLQERAREVDRRMTAVAKRTTVLWKQARSGVGLDVKNQPVGIEKPRNGRRTSWDRLTEDE